MIQKVVKSWDHWLHLKQELIDKGYYLWQWGYGWNLPEGFHAGFLNGKYDVEVITYLKAVEDDMFESRMYRNEKSPPN